MEGNLSQSYSTTTNAAPPPYTPTPDTKQSYNPDTVQFNSEKRNVELSPPVVVTQPETPPVEHTDYFNLALSATAFCFIPTGIAASIFAYKANKRFLAGDIDVAARYNRYARNLVIVSCVIGVICYIIVIVIRIKYASYSSTSY